MSATTGADDAHPVRPDVLRRRERIRRTVDVTVGRGLEIGALTSPLATRPGSDVWYVDVASTEELREHYRGDPAVDPDQLVEVHCPLTRDGRLRSVAEATAGIGPFDWVVASHVVEHVPDLIGWLADLADVLVDDGRLALVVPDRRYSFDARRPATTVGAMVAAHEARDQRPSLRAVFDHVHDVVAVSAHDLWSGAQPGPETRVHDRGYLQSRLDLFRGSDTYIDCHVWVWQPDEFLQQLQDLAALDLVGLVVTDVQPTQVGDLEFHVTLRRVPRGADAAQRRELFAAGARVGADAAAQDPAAGLQLVPITPRELRLVLAKRRALGPLRAWLHDRRRRR